MAADGSIIIDTTIDDTKIKKEINGLSVTLNKGLAIAAKGAAAGIAAIAASIAIVAKGTKVFTELTKDINSLAKMAGVSAGAFQEMSYAVSQYGVDQDALSDGMKELQIRADEFITTGAGGGAEAFDRLGYSAKDLKEGLKDVPGLFTDIIGRLEGVDKAAQIRILDEVFGGSGGEQFTAVLSGGAAAIKDLREEAQEYGLVMSEDVIDAGVELANNIEQIKTAGKGLFVDMFSGAAPVINGVVVSLNEITKQISAARKKTDEFAVSLVSSTAEQGDSISMLQTKIALLSSEYALLTEEEKDGAFGTGIKDSINELKDAIANFTGGEFKALDAALIRLSELTGESKFSLGAKYAGGDSLEKVQDAIFAAEKEAAANIVVKEAEEERAAALNEYLDLVNTEYASTQEGMISGLETEITLWEDYAKTADATLPKIEAIIRAKKEQLRILTEEVEEVDGTTQAQKDYESQVSINGEKRNAGLISERQLMTANVEALEDYVNTLIELGVTVDSLEGGDLLESLLGQLSDEKAKLEATGGGKDIGSSFIFGMIDGIISIAPAMLSAAKTAVSAISGVVNSIVDSISGAISWAAAFDVDALWKTFTDMIDGIEEFFMVDLGSLPIYFEAGSKMIKDLIDGIHDNLPAIKETINNLIESLFNTIAANIPDILMLGADILETIMNGLVSNIGVLKGTVRKVIDILVKTLIISLPYLIEMGVEMIMALVEGIAENAEALSEGLMDAVSAAIDIVSENIIEFVDLGIDIIISLIKGFHKSLPVLVKAIIGALPDIIVAFMMLQPRLLAAAPEIILSLLEGLVMGILAMPGALISAIIEVFTEFVDAIKNFFGIHSPSTMFYGFGGNIIQGLINGIKDVGSGLWNAVKSVFTGLWDGITGVFEGAKSIGSNIVGGITSGIKTAGSSIGNFASGVGNSVKKFFGGFFADGTNYAPGGLSVVGEEGPELVDVQRGSRIYTAADTKRILSAGSMASAPITAKAMVVQPIKVYINGVMDVDGKEIGRISYEYMDEIAMGA